MTEQVSFILKDISGNFADIEMSDIARPGFFLLWIGILFTPLGGVDRRDRASGVVYSLFVASAGVALIFALPQRWMDQSVSLIGQLVMVIFMSITAFMRWELGKDRFTSIEVLKEAKLQEGETHQHGQPVRERQKREK